MSLYVHIAGPDTVGAPVIRIGVGGKYGPDIIDDIKRRAVDAYRELFNDLFEQTIAAAERIDAAETGDIDEPVGFMPLDPDTEAGQ